MTRVIARRQRVRKLGVAVRWTQTWKTKLLPGGGLSATDFVVSPLPAEALP